MMIDKVLNDPCTSHWLKSAILSALRRDPVDAANDAEILANVLDEHANNVAQATRE